MIAFAREKEKNNLAAADQLKLALYLDFNSSFFYLGLYPEKKCPTSDINMFFIIIIIFFFSADSREAMHL